MPQACECSVGLGNLGDKFAADNIMRVPRMLIFVNQYSIAGGRNGIDLSVELTDASVQALIDQSNKSLRWHFLDELEDVENLRADPVFQELASGRRQYIRQGVKTFTAAIYRRNPQFLKQIERMQCPTLGVYMIDNCGDLYGMISSDGATLYPMRVGTGSFSSNLVEMTYSEEQKVMISFDFDRIEKDSDVRRLPKSEMNADLDLLSKDGLYNIAPVVVTASVTATSVRVEMNYDSGTAITPNRLEGLVAGDFALYNVTDDASVTVDSANEVSPGIYDLTILTQDGDAGTVTATKSGYDISTTSFTFGS
ncbi:MAG: hypothetical protein HRT61_00875 [Ekhidna sp.]|nr:hypothetical protein [Ekhidna sp.]